MSWTSYIPWSNSLKTRAFRQLIHHYLGVFFQEKLSLDQLSVDLSTGRGKVKDVILNLDVLNESLTNNNIPFEVVKAYVGEINLLIPWTSILNDNSLLDIKDLEITIRPKQTNDPNISNTNFELTSMFNSMNTSMLIAQECLKDEIDNDQNFAGLTTFAAAIDSILARARVTLTDTVIRLEHLINNSDHGVALEIRIKKFEYYDSEATSIDMTVPSETNSAFRPTVFTNKNFVLSDVTLYTDEFSIYNNSSSMTESITNSLSRISDGNTRMIGYETFDPVLCLTIAGKQDIRLKLKQSEQTVGPKVEIEAYCGSLNCLLTPKQLQSLIILLTAYQKAALYSTSDRDLYNRAPINNRPRIDDHRYHFSHFDNTAADSSDTLFCSIKGTSQSIDLESSYTSSRPDTTSVSSQPHRSSSNQTTTDKSHLKETTKRLLEQSQSITNTKCRLQFNFISLCLLHQDIQTNNQTLKEFSDSYFSNISTINTTGILDEKQINEHRLKYSQACSKDHLSLIGKPLIIDFIQQSAENCLYLDLDIRFSSVDLCECLQTENTNIPPKAENQMVFNRLLSFVRSNETTTLHSGSSFQVPVNGIQSSIQISITNFSINPSKKKKSTNASSVALAGLKPFNDVNIRLASCQIDFDLTIIDRIYSSINACQINNSSTTNKTSNESLTMLTINSPNCILNLRFPIPDLQPLNKRRPWWIQSVHKEMLTFDLKQMNFQSDFDSNETTTLTVTSEAIQVFYHNNNGEQSHIAQLSSNKGERIKFVIDLKEHFPNQFSPATRETFMDSIFSGLLKNDNNLPLKNKNILNDNRQVLEVADDETIQRFLLTCSQETKLNLHITIPYVLFYISDQVFVETIYNRFVNNLFLWESSVPKPNNNINPILNNSNTQLMNSYGSHSSERTYDQRAHTLQALQTKEPSTFVLNLNVQDIHIVADAPMGDKMPKESRANPSNIGEFRIDGQGLTLALVEGYQGDANLRYFCLLIHSASVYHNGHGTVMKSNASLNERLNRSLSELVTGLPTGVFPKYNNNGTMIRSAYEIRTIGDQSEGKQKLIRGSFAFEGAMIHQKFLPKAENWILQMIDLFEYKDEEIAGYIPLLSRIETHLELRHCAIHYRPLYFDTRCFVTIDSCTLTTTYVRNSQTTKLEINLDDWAIYLSKQKRDRYQIDLLKDYICLINGLAFQIKLSLNQLIENTPMIDPLIDICIACDISNIIHIRSCSDSVNALIELLKYILTDGDLQQQTAEINRSSTSIKREKLDRSVQILNDEASNEMVLEAVREERQQLTSSVTRSTMRYDDEEENSMLESRSSGIEYGPAFSSSMSSIDNDSLRSKRQQNTSSIAKDQGYEMLEREIGMCRPPQNGLCEVHVLTENSIQIHENHFSKPLERNDILNAPAHLPIPTLRFSIRQLSVVWHIYDGNDFALPTPNDRGPFRDLKTSMEFSISRACFQYETYDEREKVSSRFVFTIRTFEILDRLLARSRINKFLHLYITETAPKRTHADMFIIKVLHTKPEGYIMKTADEECEIKVSLQPLKINIDQDTLIFMRNFFVNLKTSSDNRETSAPIPVPEQNATNLSTDNPSSSYESDLNTSPTVNNTTPTNSAIFIKHFVFSPGCHIRIDYHGKFRNEQLFESGTLFNILIGLAQLTKVDIYLKRISYKRGLKGYDKLLTFLLEKWLNDNRTMDVIKSVIPLPSIFHIAIGIKDLFYLPFYQYRRDGRLGRGIQLGASSFTTNTALGLIEFGGQVVRCAHFAASTCFELVSPSSNESSSSTQTMMVQNHRTTSHQLRTEAQRGQRQNGGFISVIGALIRQMPSLAIQPIVTTTKAVDSVLVGARNHFNPDERNDDKEKYRNEQ